MVLNLGTSADDNISVRNMVLLGAPVDEWKIDNVQNVHNFTSGSDLLSWNVNLNPNNPVSYQQFGGVKHYNPNNTSLDWTCNQGVRDAVNNITGPAK